MSKPRQASSLPPLQNLSKGELQKLIFHLFPQFPPFPVKNRVGLNSSLLLYRRPADMELLRQQMAIETLTTANARGEDLSKYVTFN